MLVIGAGRSSASLIQYLKTYSKAADVKLVIADADLQPAGAGTGSGTEQVQSVALDIFNEEQLNKLTGKADVVISMVPSGLHLPVATACIRQKKHMLSASYVTEEISSLHQKATEAGITMLKECGLDPGLDHMTAMRVIKQIKAAGGELLSFTSFTGGLVAPESDDNPWNYKFTWNPRNVVLAGKGVASYISRGEYKYIPYQKLFSRTEPIYLEGTGEFEGYANRDSLSYRRLYGIEDIPTLLRGTIRRKGYCAAWNVFVQLGMTDDSFIMEGTEKMTRRDFLNAFLPFGESAAVEEKLCSYTGIAPGGDEFNKISWLGFFERIPLKLKKASPAQALQNILEEKWKLKPGDKDMVVMQHKFVYSLEGRTFRRTSSLISMGDNPQQTAMAKTVGLPLGIAATLILEGKISRRGVCIPVTPDIYDPVLAGLENLGIKMEEKEEEL